MDANKIQNATSPYQKIQAKDGLKNDSIEKRDKQTESKKSKS